MFLAAPVWHLLFRLLLGLLTGAWLGLACAAPAVLTVSAAGSLAPAFRDLAQAFEASHPGVRIDLNLGASGVLLAQVLRGAPVDVLAVADVQTMDRAQAAGALASQTRRSFAGNTLVLAVPLRSVRPPASLGELRGAAYARIAIGQPAWVPAGRYAQVALEAAGLWRELEPKVVYAGSARQVMDYLARGEVDAAFVYATDAAQTSTRSRVAFPVASSAPIRYQAAATRSALQPAWAGRFVAFLVEPAAQAILARHGFMSGEG